MTQAEEQSGIVVVRPDIEEMSRQKLPFLVGITSKTAGAKGISMSMIIIPPGGSAAPHYHRGHESAIYMIEGRVDTRYGPGLKQSVITEAGDFVFIAPGVPHQPVNLSETERAIAIVARNDPDEQENVVDYDPSAEA